jgi:hypothetical protein
MWLRSGWFLASWCAVVGAGILTALGILLIGVALIALVRRSPAARP